MSYGKALVLDLHHCEAKLDRKTITNYFNEACKLMEMEQCKLVWWDYYWWPSWIIKIMKWDQDDEIFGTSAVQFIRTSNITIHALPNLKKVYVDIFSCKLFEEDVIGPFTKNFFKGTIANQHVFERW